MGGGGSKKQTVGYKYYLGLHAVFVHGPVDSCTQVYFDKKLAFEGNLTAAQSFGISRKNLFGGEDVGAEGGVSGVVHWCPGAPTQTQNAYLQAKLGTTDIPAFRGVAAMIFEDFYFGTTKYLKPVSARMKRIHTTTGGEEQWYDEKAEVGGALIAPGSLWDYQVAPGLTVPPNPATFPIPEDGWNLTAPAPFGTNNTGFLYTYPIRTAWTPGQHIWLRKTIRLSSDYGAFLQLFTEAENSCFVWWDGVYIGAQNPTNEQGGDGSTIINVPEGLATPGFHTIHVYALDEAGSESNPGSSDTYIYLEMLGVNEPGDMNPAHIIRECLTDSVWGMGYQAGDIGESFEAAADELFDENFGLSLLWDRQMTIEQFIGEIIKHIDGALYVDRRTGLFELKLIRGDYDVETLPLLDESNIDKIEGFSRPVFGELVNSVTVNFWDRNTGQDSSLTITDPALIQMQGAVINTTLQYPGITNAELASRVGMRDLQSLSNPIVSCTIYANSVAEDFTIGSVFLFSWEDYGIVEMPMRVTAIAYGDGVKNAVKMTCTQDVFKLPQTAVITPPTTEWEDPNQPPAPIDVQYAEEMTYYEFVQRRGQVEADQLIAANVNLGRTAFAAARPQDAAINARIWVDAGAGYEESLAPLDFAPAGELTADIGRLTDTVTLKNVTDETVIETGRYATFTSNGEKVYVVSYDPLTNELVMRRSVLDSVPELHFEDDVIIFDDVYVSSDDVDYVESDEVDVKLLTATGAGQVDIDDATAMTIDFNSRMARPYPPANVKINGTSYPPEDTIYNGTVEVTWNTRNRLLQTSADLVAWDDASDVALETNVEVAIEVYDTDTETLVFSDSAITTPYDVTANLVLNNRIELFCVNTVTSLESFRRVVMSFQYGAVQLFDNFTSWSIGNEYAHTPNRIGGVAPFVWSIETGYLPDGLTLNTSTGEITGTPAVAGVFNFTLRVTDDTDDFAEIAVQQEIVEDPHFSKVIFLAGFNGADAATAATDESPVGRALTFVGNAQLDTAQKKWGTASLLLDGTGDYVTAPDAADLTIAAQNFNFAGWVRWNVAPGTGLYTFLSHYHSSGNNRGWVFGINGGNLRVLYSTTGGNALILQVAWLPVANTWYYVEIVRSGTTLYFVVDGVLIGTQTIGTDAFFDANTPLQVGTQSTGNDGNMNGWLDDLRLTVGTPRQTTGFVNQAYPHPRRDFARMTTENTGEQIVTEEGEINLKENPHNV